jgi:hypothetical protein
MNSEERPRNMKNGWSVRRNTFESSNVELLNKSGSRSEKQKASLVKI